jgi:hypothetical protein
MNTATSVALAALIFVLLGFAGEQDYLDAKASEAAYCARVADKAHTDYLELGEVCDD